MFTHILFVAPPPVFSMDYSKYRDIAQKVYCYKSLDFWEAGHLSSATKELVRHPRISSRYN